MSYQKIFSIKRFLVIAGPLMVLVLGLLVYKKSCSSRIRNVLLISIDTCRADRLSCYGFERKTTPNIDRIAQEGILFENAISPVPFTLPAHSSMLTGTIPPYHGVHDNVSHALDESNVTLAELLKPNGFETAAFISVFVLDSQFGLDQGFDSYNDRFEDPLKGQYVEQRAGAETTRFAIEWLEENNNEKFFLFLHYFDPHAEYEPPEPFATRFLLDPYAGEIAYTDHCIGQVVDKLKELGLYDSTLIIITSDHGESLGEHGEQTHGYFIYQSTIKVPLIFRVPGGPADVRIGSNVSLVDIVPTVCKLLGIEFSNDIQGKDLTGYINDPDSEPYPDRYVFCESLEPTSYNANPLLGVVTGRYKYIMTSNSELYDLYEDPGEMRNLIAKHPDRARLMQDKLRQIIDAAKAGNQTSGSSEMDAETLRKLESLGYVSGSVDENYELDENKNDPKALIKYHELNARIPVFNREEQYDAAAKVCQKMISLHPDIYLAYYQLGKISFFQKDYASAAAYLEKTLELEPDHLSSHINLAKSFDALGKHDKAIEHFLKAKEIDPGRGDLIAQEELGIDIRNLNIQCAELIAQKKYDEARLAAAKIVNLRPDYYLGYDRLAEIAMNQGRFPESILYLKKELELVPENFEAHGNLGRAYNSTGKFDEAIKHFNEALRLKPDFVGVLNALARILAARKDTKLYDPTEAVKLAERACKLTDYKRPELMDTLAAAYAATGMFDKALETAQNALVLAKSFGKEALAKNIQERLELYKAHQPYRQFPEKNNE